jgi:serine/threonine-protein kinase
MFDEYETNLLSRLDHPAIPDIIERRAVGDMFYLVLKFGGSRTLGSERKQHADGRVPLEKLLTWMRQLCEVLIYLHTQTPPIIHRDLKPDNILLDENERIMLIDFGIAKEAVPEAMTRTLGRAATMHFSPPEQVMGTGTDERADIYALGATFYALLTGQNPPAAPERVSGKELTPPSELVADLPPELDDAIMQALELNMNHRQQSVREFAQALDGLVYSENSRPLRSEAETGRTQLMGGQATQQTQNKSAGLKIPTGRAATARNRSAPIAPVEAAAPPPNKMPLIVGGAVLALLALAAGVFWWQSSKTGEKPETAVVSPQSPPVSNPLAQPPVAAPVAPQPVPATPQTPPPVPAQQVTPPSAEPAQAPAGSAEEILRNSRKPEVVEPPATPTPEPEPAPSKPKPKPKPKPAPDPVAPKPSRHKLTPSPPPPAPEQWKIIPGGARKTD